MAKVTEGAGDAGEKKCASEHYGVGGKRQATQLLWIVTLGNPIGADAQGDRTLRRAPSLGRIPNNGMDAVHLALFRIGCLARPYELLNCDPGPAISSQSEAARQKGGQPNRLGPPIYEKQTLPVLNCSLRTANTRISLGAAYLAFRYGRQTRRTLGN